MTLIAVKIILFTNTPADKHTQTNNDGGKINEKP